MGAISSNFAADAVGESAKDETDDKDRQNKAATTNRMCFETWLPNPMVSADLLY
jgi:hypothetical protein